MTTILLTATIAPSPDAALHVQFNPEERLSQYREALVHVLCQPGPGWQVLFVDNSGYPLDTLRRVAEAHARHDRPVRFLSYRSEIPPAWGKGRGEVALIETALLHFANILPEDAPIWKLTGRLKVRNLGEMVATQPEDYIVYADFRQVPLIGESLGGNNCTDTKLIAFTPLGWRECLKQDWPNRRFTVEKLLFKALAPQLGPGSAIVPRFRVQPRFEGVSGGSGKSYTSGMDRAKTELRALMRRVAPWLWL